MEEININNDIAVVGITLKSNYEIDNEFQKNLIDFGNTIHQQQHLDKSFFGNENESLSFQEKLLLQCCWEAFEDAQINPLKLNGSNTSVFVYSDIVDESSNKVSFSNAISSFFNFNGISSETLNSGNSSINVLNNGFKSIQNGNSNYSIVCVLHLNNQIQYVSVIILKQLSLAIQDSDLIYCVIKSLNESNNNKRNNIIFESFDSKGNYLSSIDNNGLLNYNKSIDNDFLLFSKCCLLLNNQKQLKNYINIYNLNSMGEKIIFFNLSKIIIQRYNENESRDEQLIENYNQKILIPFSANSIHSLKKYQSLLIKDKENKFENSIPFSEFTQHQINSKSISFNNKLVSIASDWKEFKQSVNCIESTKSKNSKPIVITIFSGQGGHWNKMGMDLYSNFPVFKKSVDDLDNKMFKYFGHSIFDKLRSIKDDDMVSINDPMIIQPALFIFNVSLYNLYKHWGIHPSIMVGHSLGEDSSFYCSGAVDLDSICSVIYHRSCANKKMVGKGKMLVINISEDEYFKHSFNEKYSLEICCFNSANAIVVGGNELNIKGLESELKEMGIFCSLMGTSIPYHTNIQNLIKSDILSNCNNINHQQPNIPLFSTLSTNIYNDLENPYDSNYVFNSFSKPVYFEKTVSNIYKYIEFSNGSSDNIVFLEISAHPILSFYLKEMITSNNVNKKSVSIYSAMHKKKDDVEEFQKTIANLFVFNNLEIDFNCQFNSKSSSNYKSNTKILPHYQWNNENIIEVKLNENIDRGMSTLTISKKEILQKISKLLKINQSLIDVNKRLINYGADSLLIVQLKNWVDKELGFKNIVTIQQLQVNSISNSIEIIETRYKALSSGEIVINKRSPKEQKEFWLNEMKLNDSIQSLPLKQETEKRVFITGITGFLGAFMLVHLLKMEQCPIVYCLLRNKSGSTNPINEIIGNLKHHQLYDQLKQSQIEKIVPMVGDLAKVKLGLSEKDYLVVSQNSNLIINSGADLNLESDYHSNKPVNVDGILEIINLSISGEFQKPIVNFSTFTVFINQSLNGIPFDESVMPSLDNIDNLPAGYMQSKVIGEYILMEAAKRGIPSMLIRPPSIFSNPETGVGLSSDFFQLSVQCCYSTGYYPNVEMKCLLTPVDWMSDNIMNLILTDCCWSNSLLNEMNIYNVYGDIVSYNEIYEPLERLYNCKPIEFEKWRQMILDSDIESCIKFRSFHSMDFHLKHNIDSGLNISKKTKKLLKSLGSYNENWRINDKMISSHINYIFNNKK